MDIKNLKSTESPRSSPPDRRPVVFIDIDDVLCAHKKCDATDVLSALHGKHVVDFEHVFNEIFDPAARDNLRQLHDEFEPHYVITSSWTVELTPEQMRTTLTRAGFGFVADNFHPSWVTPRDDDSYRLVEIDAWFDICGSFRPSLYAPTPFVVLDDELSGQSLVGSHLEEWVVFCEPSIGFIDSKLAEARAILRRQSRRSAAD